jgi:hypothetical protein
VEASFAENREREAKIAQPSLPDLALVSPVTGGFGKLLADSLNGKTGNTFLVNTERHSALPPTFSPTVHYTGSGVFQEF